MTYPTSKAITIFGTCVLLPDACGDASSSSEGLVRVPTNAAWTELPERILAGLGLQLSKEQGGLPKADGRRRRMAICHRLHVQSIIVMSNIYSRYIGIAVCSSTTYVISPLLLQSCFRITYYKCFFARRRHVVLGSMTAQRVISFVRRGRRPVFRTDVYSARLDGEDKSCKCLYDFRKTLPTT